MSRAKGELPPVPEPLPHPVADTHTHLDISTGARLPLAEKDLPPEYEVEQDADAPALPDVDEFRSRALAAGVTRAVQIGCELPSARWTAQLVADDDSGWLVGGGALHPNEAPRLAAAGLLEDALSEIDRLVAGPRMRVVGETGLDYFRTGDEGKPAQEESFRAHIEIAKRRGLALQIHDREAHADVLRVLDDAGAPDRVILHCFSGDSAFAAECAARGFYMSFAGNITFKNAEPLRQALREVPEELLLLETDAPFLTPVPYRGAPGGSYLTALTARGAAEVRGEELEALCRRAWHNAETAIGGW